LCSWTVQNMPHFTKKVTSLIHTCNRTHSYTHAHIHTHTYTHTNTHTYTHTHTHTYVWHDWCMSVIRLIHMCDMTHMMRSSVGGGIEVCVCEVEELRRTLMVFTNESCHTYEWVMYHMYKWVMSHVCRWRNWGARSWTVQMMPPVIMLQRANSRHRWVRAHTHSQTLSS